MARQRGSEGAAKKLLLILLTEMWRSLVGFELRLGAAVETLFDVHAFLIGWTYPVTDCDIRDYR